MSCLSGQQPWQFRSHPDPCSQRSKQLASDENGLSCGLASVSQLEVDAEHMAADVAQALRESEALVRQWLECRTV